jgi:hypothetical protein
VDVDRLAAARAHGDSIQPLSTGRSYVNAIDTDATDKVRAAFPPANYDEPPDIDGVSWPDLDRADLAGAHDTRLPR